MTEELWPGGPRYRQGPEGFPLTLDAVLLAHFTGPIRGKKLMDLGCGAGALTVLLGAAHPGAALSGVELRPAAAALCRENLAANGADPGGILTGDLRKYRELWRPGSFDLVAANPPYFPLGSGASSPSADRAGAREERDCTLADLCAAAAWLLGPGGAFALVYRPERLSELCCAMAARDLEPKRLRLVQQRPDSAPVLVLMEGRRGGKPGLKIEKPLILRDPEGGDSAELRTIYHLE